MFSWWMIALAVLVGYVMLRALGNERETRMELLRSKLARDTDRREPSPEHTNESHPVVVGSPPAKPQKRAA